MDDWGSAMVKLAEAEANADAARTKRTQRQSARRNMRVKQVVQKIRSPLKKPYRLFSENVLCPMSEDSGASSVWTLGSICSGMGTDCWAAKTDYLLEHKFQHVFWFL